MEFKFVPLKQNTVKNIILDHTRSDSTSVSLATRGFLIESWREGDMAQGQKIEQIFCIVEYTSFIPDGA